MESDKSGPFGLGNPKLVISYHFVAHVGRGKLKEL